MRCFISDIPPWACSRFTVGGTEGFGELVQLLLFAIHRFFPISTHSQVRISFPSLAGHITAQSPTIHHHHLAFFSIPALCLVLIKICKFPDGEKKLVYFSSVRSDSRETHGYIKDLPPFMYPRVHPQRWRLKPWTGYPHTAHLQDSAFLHPVCSTPSVPRYHCNTFLRSSLGRVLSKKYFHSNVKYFSFSMSFFKNIYNFWGHSENAPTLDCGEDARSYFLSGNTIWSSEHQHSVAGQKIFFSFCLYFQKPHLNHIVRLYVCF